MIKFLKCVKYGFWGAWLVLLLVALITVSVLNYQTIPTWHQTIPSENFVLHHSDDYQRAAKKSRQSTVKISSRNLKLWNGAATTTGTYFTANKKHYVITVHHGIIGPCWLQSVIYHGEHYSCKEYVKVDVENDYVIIELEASLKGATPIKIPQDLPHGGQWKKSYSILNSIIYTGYPNVIGPLTLRGDVVGYSEEQYLYIFSHAYGGASGSGIFTKEGKYIGYIVAIDVGSTEFGVDVLENIVVVAPAFNVDWNVVIN